MKPSDYGAALIAVCAASIATAVIQPWMGSSLSVLFFPAIIITALYGGYVPALIATVLSTAALAFFFVPPHYSFDIGADDAIRLAVFAAVAVVTASVSSGRRRAEDAQRRAVSELHAALTTLRKVSGWPTFVGAGLAAGAQRLLQHAATVVGCARVVAAWEAEDEPYVFVADSASPSSLLTRIAPSDHTVAGDLTGGPSTLACQGPRGEAADASAPFELEHLTGRVFFIGLAAPGGDVIPLAEVVAREVGNSLEQLAAHDRQQQVAVREDRIRLARDLHDGVLQALTGIRIQLQLLADGPADTTRMRDQLVAIERALAIEQRELRRFIEELKPVGRPDTDGGDVARALAELRDRLGAEWQAPITIRVSPPDLRLRADVEEGVRLMVREAAINALKHAHPSRVSVEVAITADGALRVVVSDDGRGFSFRGRLDHDALMSSPAKPVSLYERVQELGGTIAIDSAATGSRVEITLPAVRASI